jgi:hypothetical protein
VVDVGKAQALKTEEARVSACRAACDAHKECSGFLYDRKQSNRRCTFYGGILGSRAYSSWDLRVRQDADCYEKRAPAVGHGHGGLLLPHSQTEVDFTKPRLTSTVLTESAAECKVACGENLVCVAGTWFASTKSCWLTRHLFASSGQMCKGECESFRPDRKALATDPALVTNAEKAVEAVEEAMQSSGAQCGSEYGADASFTACSAYAKPYQQGVWSISLISSKFERVTAEYTGMENGEFFIVKVTGGQADRQTDRQTDRLTGR